MNISSPSALHAVLMAQLMVESAAHLVDHVLPEQPIRRWVLTLPFPLRFLFAAHSQVLSQVLAMVYRTISTDSPQGHCHVIKR
jgi:hypothetical protein